LADPHVQIWNHVSNDRSPDGKPCPGGATDDEAQKRTVQAQIEKKTMINLVQAYSVSMKHLLRSEPGVYYEDLYPLVCMLPRFAAPEGALVNESDMMPMWHASELTLDPSLKKTNRAALSRNPSTSNLPQLRAGSPRSNDDAVTEKAGWFGSKRSASKVFDPEAVLPVFGSDRPLKPARNPPQSRLYDYFPFLRLFTAASGHIKRAVDDDYATTKAGRALHRKYVNDVESNVPLEICLFLSSYHSWLFSKGHLTPAIGSAISACITQLQDAAMNLQRIKNTPLPFAYQAHLRMSLYAYLLYFPFAIYPKFGWFTIPALTFTSFLFVGFLEIGQEIENPFNYDDNDLDLDGFCLSVQRELAEITAHVAPSHEEFVFTGWNQPFAPADRRTAQEIVADVGHDYHNKEEGTRALQRTMLRSWREVDAQTRQHNVDVAPFTRG
jgi:putative membrane protein